MRACDSRRYGWVVLALAGLASASCAGEPLGPPAQATTTESVALDPAAATTSGFWPDLGWPTTCWFAAVVILALAIRLKPLLTIRTLRVP